MKWLGGILMAGLLPLAAHGEEWAGTGAFVCAVEDAYWIDPVSADRGPYTNRPRSFKLTITRCEDATRYDCTDLDDYEVKTDGLRQGESDNWPWHLTYYIWENRLYAHNLDGSTLVMRGDNSFRLVKYGSSQDENEELFWVMAGSCFDAD